MSRSDVLPHPTQTGIASSRRTLFWIGFYAVILLAWSMLFLIGRGPSSSSIPGMTSAEFWASLCSGAASADPAALFGMWGVMTAAMMLPTFVPAVRVFDELGDVQASNAKSMSALVSGYSAAWLVFCALGALMQLLLSRTGIIAPDGTSLSPWLTAGLLLAAGGYQLSHVKSACLAKCRHPLTFFLAYWRPGSPAAFAMGLRLGLACLGCCWVLMTLSFVGGAMNLLWMGLATLFMTFEKLPQVGRYLTKPAAAILLLAAGVTLLRALQLI
jgi:predicted metal-binding membrane protein